MEKIKAFFLVTVVSVGLLGLVACEKSPENTMQQAEEQDVNKPVVGNEQTGEYADKFATVEKKSGDPVDPYTASQDKANYAGKQPIADEQTPADRADKNH